MRRERREKFKVKETQRLLETLGVSEAGKVEAMAVAPEEKDSQNVEKDQQNEHVVVEPTKNIQNTSELSTKYLLWIKIIIGECFIFS